jgi:UV DNA damage endonuclease
VYGKTGIPVVFDTLHHGCNSGGETMLNAFSGAHATWKGQDSKKKKGAHSQSIQTRGFKSFINRTKGFDFDIMFEIKDKEQSALQAFRFLHSKKTE